MTESLTLPQMWTTTVETVSEVTSSQIEVFLKAFAPNSETLAPEWASLLERSVAGGKRLRAMAAIVGAATTRDAQNGPDLLKETSQGDVLQLAAALEFYQASALVHDDVIDRSDYRRGLPSTHRSLTQTHQKHGWIDSPEHFGTSGAILAGNFLLASGESALSSITSASATSVAAQYAQMTSEVAYGQYLDLRASNLPLSRLEDPVEMALQIVRLKSARYSVVHPVLLGATLAEAEPAFVGTLEQIFEPAGIAFQLRDDTLGVFGAPEETGKPIGNDILEKKRTVLLGLAYRHGTSAQKQLLDDAYQPDGSVPVTDVIDVLDIAGSSPHESMISALRQQSEERLAAAQLAPGANELCSELIDRVTLRRS